MVDFMKFYIIFIISLIMIVSCSNDTSKKTSLLSEYISAQDFLEKKLFKRAIKKLENIYQDHSFKSLHKQIQLNLIYAYYKNKNFYQSDDLVNNFIKLYLVSKNADFILYIKGIINIFIDKNIFKKTLYISISDRSIKNIKIAYLHFMKLLEKFPHSKYFSDAKKKSNLLIKRLIYYDFSIFEFYLKKKAYITVINRVSKFIKNFPNTKETKSAYLIMYDSYEKINLNEEKEMIRKYLKYKTFY